MRLDTVMLAVCLAAGWQTASAQATFGLQDNVLTLPTVRVDRAIYRNVQIRLDPDGRMTVLVLPAPVAPRSAALPPSGANIGHCYRAGSNQLVDCGAWEATTLSGSGKQDGMHEAGLSLSELAKPGGGSYARTECIVDTHTGLVWEGKTDDRGLRDWRNLYTYFGDRRVGDVSAYVQAVNTLRLCGFDDWRVPSLHELHGLLDYGRTAQPLLYPGWFPHFEGMADSPDYYSSLLFWTSTAAPSGFKGSFRGIYFGRDGYSVASSGGTGSGGKVRLVRGGAPQESRFVPSTTGSEVVDATRGLTWRRCHEGMTWIAQSCSGGTGACGICSGQATTFTHEEALAHARQQTDWRLPTAKELATTIHPMRSAPAADPAIFPGIGSGTSQGGPWVWTSTPFLIDTGYAWTVNYAYGVVEVLRRGEKGPVRLVRATP